MKAIKIILLFIILAFGYTNTMNAQSSKEIKIKERADSFFEAFNDKDMDKLLDFYDENAIAALQNTPIMVGREAIKKGYEGFFKISINLKHKVTSVNVKKKRAVALGEVYITGTDEKGQNFTEKGRFFFVFKKSTDGKWRAIYDMDNRAPDIDPSKWK